MCSLSESWDICHSGKVIAQLLNGRIELHVTETVTYSS